MTKKFSNSSDEFWEGMGWVNSNK